MPLGLPGSTMISSVLVANVTGSPIVPSPSGAVSLSMLFWSAEAKMSATAPSLMLPTRSDEAPKLNVTLLSGFAVMKASPIEVKESVSDAAANTSRSPDTASVLHAGALDIGSDPVGRAPRWRRRRRRCRDAAQARGGERSEDHLRPCHRGPLGAD